MTAFFNYDTLVSRPEDSIKTGKNGFQLLNMRITKCPKLTYAKFWACFSVTRSTLYTLSGNVKGLEIVHLQPL